MLFRSLKPNRREKEIEPFRVVDQELGSRDRREPSDNRGDQSDGAAVPRSAEPVGGDHGNEKANRRRKAKSQKGAGGVETTPQESAPQAEEVTE